MLEDRQCGICGRSKLSVNYVRVGKHHTIMSATFICPMCDAGTEMAGYSRPSGVG